MKVWRAFWHGFVTPSPLALGLMLLSFALTAWVAIVTPTADRIAGSWGRYLPRAADDNQAFVTREALQLAQPPAADDQLPRLAVMGSSISAQAFASEPDMAAAMRKATGKDWRVSLLTTPLQGTVDEAALADHASRGRKGVVVLPVGFARFGAPASEYVETGKMERLGIRSDWADAQMRMMGAEPRKPTGNYAIDNRNFLFRNADALLVNWLTGTVPERRVDAYLFVNRPHDTQRKEMLRFLERSGKPDPLATRLLGDIVRRLKARGSQVLIFEEPVNPVLLAKPEHSALYAAHLVRSAKVAAAVGADYCITPPAMRPTIAEYGDFDHVGAPAARARLRDALAACVARLAAKGEPQ